MFHDYAPGAPFWLPKGEHIYDKLSLWMRDLLVDRSGYVSVKTPLLFDKKLWETSGHWEHYSDNMFSFQEDPEDTEGVVEHTDDHSGCCGRTFGFETHELSISHAHFRVSKTFLQGIATTDSRPGCSSP